MTARRPTKGLRRRSFEPSREGRPRSVTGATDVFARMQAVETSLQKVTDMLKVHSKDTGGSVPADAIVEEGAKAAKDETTEQSSDKEN